MKYAVVLFVGLVGCGAEQPEEPKPAFVTKQGVLVFDDTGSLTKADVEEAIELARTYAPDQDRIHFDMLDGFTMRFFVDRTVEQCTSGPTKALGCVDRELDAVLLAQRTCAQGEYRHTVSTLAHEIGHIVTGEDGHTNDAWYGYMGVSDQVQLAKCGTLPKPGE